MSDQKPAIGRIVHYVLTEQDVARVAADHGSPPRGMNAVQAGDTYPAVVVREWGDDLVNLHVLLDGPFALWATSRRLGDGQQGCWHWPPRL